MTVMSTGRVEFRPVPVHVPTERTDFGHAPTVRRPYGVLRRMLAFGPFLLAFETLPESTSVDALDVSRAMLENLRACRSSAQAAAILAAVALAPMSADAVVVDVEDA
jgi:hypothetical protein